MTVFHGDVYCICPVWCSVAGMVCLLLERSPENSVLDWCCHLFLGMLEKAVFYAEFQNIRYKGESGIPKNVCQFVSDW